MFEHNSYELVIVVNGQIASLHFILFFFFISKTVFLSFAFLLSFIIELQQQAEETETNGTFHR